MIVQKKALLVLIEPKLSNRTIEKLEELLAAGWRVEVTASDGKILGTEISAIFIDEAAAIIPFTRGDLKWPTT